MSLKICTVKSLPLALIALFALTAQAGGGMSEEQMQQMMEQTQKMQECMAGIDQSRLEALAARAESMDKEIKALCTAGKRDQAQDVAIKYGKEISQSPEMQEMRKCSEGMMQQMPMMADLEEDYTDRHVCDDL